jgi:hypothetical protein
MMHPYPALLLQPDEKCNHLLLRLLAPTAAHSSVFYYTARETFDTNFAGDMMHGKSNPMAID